MHSPLRPRRCRRASCAAFLVQAHSRFPSAARRLRAIRTGGSPPSGSASRSCRPSTGSSTPSASWSCAPSATTRPPAGPSAPPCCGAALSPRWPRGCASSCACWSSPARRRPIRRLELPDDGPAGMLASAECSANETRWHHRPRQAGCTVPLDCLGCNDRYRSPISGGVGYWRNFLKSPLSWCIRMVHFCFAGATPLSRRFRRVGGASSLGRGPFAASRWTSCVSRGVVRSVVPFTI